MQELTIHRATPEEAALVGEMIRFMAEEMAQMSGHAVTTSPPVWQAFEADLSANLGREDFICLLARRGEVDTPVLGIVVANPEPLEELFNGEPRLHISAVYVIPVARRQGIASQLIEDVLAWGQSMGIAQADLNVLAANPALDLYRRLGFHPFEIAMVKKLR